MTELKQNSLESAFQEQLSVVIPVGVVLPYAGQNPPDGWLDCDGAAVSRTTYAKLFIILGTAFGTGDGSSTFNLPDMRGKTPMGADTMNSTTGAANQLRLDKPTIMAALLDPSGSPVDPRASVASKAFAGAATGARVLSYIIKVTNTLPSISTSYPAP